MKPNSETKESMKSKTTKKNEISKPDKHRKKIKTLNKNKLQKTEKTNTTKIQNQTNNKPGEA